MMISVIVPCRNERGHVIRFLDNLLAQELDADWQLEILIADGLSDDGTRELLQQFSHVRIIDNPGRIVSTGLNAAIGAATGDIIIRMDVHTTYARDYLRECVNALQETSADNVGGPWVAEGKGTVGKAIAAGFQSRFCAGGGRAHDPNYEGEIDTVYLGCWPRAVFDRVGLFDPGLVRNQDDEFNFRLRRFGGKVWQSPRIRSCYTPRNSISAVFRQYLQYGFWKVAVIRKHRALASWRHVVPMTFVASLLALLVLLASASLLGMDKVAFAAGGVLATELAAYALACVVSTLLVFRSHSLGTLLLMPVVMAVYHFAYGLGFLIGVLTAPGRRGSGATSPTGFLTELTR